MTTVFIPDSRLPRKMNLDFKSVRLTNSYKLGFSSIMCSLTVFVEGAKGTEALVNHMRDFMKERGIDVLLCYCAAEQLMDRCQEEHSRKGVVFAVNVDSGVDVTLFSLIKRVLYECPQLLTASLKTNGLFTAQDIPGCGFDPQEWPLEGGEFNRVGFFHLRHNITRKTLMPTFAEILPLLLRQPNSLGSQ